MKARSVRPILGLEQIETITAAVREAEARTSGQIVPVILRQSDQYPAARWRMATFAAAISAFVCVVARPALHPIWYLWAEVPAWALGYWLGAIPALQRWFLARAEMDEEVRQRALEAFRFEGLDRTRERTGVLILVSLFERRVQVLADRGISSQLPQQTWDRLVASLGHRIGQGELAEGLRAAITECGELLAARFPPRPGQANELSDRPRLGD
jgi:putative membrane protein